MGKAKKKIEISPEDEIRKNFSYVTFPSIAKAAKEKAFNESPSKTLSSKIEELLIQYNNTK